MKSYLVATENTATSVWFWSRISLYNRLLADVFYKVHTYTSNQQTNQPTGRFKVNLIMKDRLQPERVKFSLLVFVMLHKNKDIY